MISVKQLTEFTPWAVLSVCCLLVAIPAAFRSGRTSATEAAAPWSSVVATTFRLKPHEDLMDALLSFTRTNRISAASTTDGSSGFYSNDSKRYEIVSLVGTLEYNSATDKATGHLHIGLADEHGVVIGGHLVTGCRVYTTAEVTLLRCPSLQHTRVHDPDSGYDELMVVPTNDAYLSYKAT